MQIKKSKGVTSIKLTQAERRQLAAAEEIIDTIQLMGGTREDVEIISETGEVSFGGSAEVAAPAVAAAPVKEEALEEVAAPAVAPKSRKK